MTVLFAVPVPVPDPGWAVECALREYLLDENQRHGRRAPGRRRAPRGCLTGFKRSSHPRHHPVVT